MTVYIEVPYYGIVEVDEATHVALRTHIPRRFITIWRKLADKVYEENRVTIPRVTFSEWLYLAYQQRSYYIYKRLQVVKILYQPEDKESKRSPRPFADTRAWIYEQFYGEEADDEIEEGSSFTYITGERLGGIFATLDKEAETCFGLVTSIVCAFYHGVVTEITEAVENEIVDEEEVLDIGVIHRAVIIYKYWEDVLETMTRRLGNRDVVEEMMEDIESTRFKVGLYKDDDLVDKENALRYEYYKKTGKRVEAREFRDMIYEWVQIGEWTILAKLHLKAFGIGCKGIGWAG